MYKRQIKYCNGSSSNNSGNINIILRKIDAKKYKHGAALLGISSSRAIEALGDTRNELTHYILSLIHIYCHESLSAGGRGMEEVERGTEPEA